VFHDHKAPWSIYEIEKVGLEVSDIGHAANHIFKRHPMESQDDKPVLNLERICDVLKLESIQVTHDRCRVDIVRFRTILFKLESVESRPWVLAKYPRGQKHDMDGLGQIAVNISEGHGVLDNAEQLVPKHIVGNVARNVAA
jgi:hypothetical protein